MTEEIEYKNQQNDQSKTPLISVLLGLVANKNRPAIKCPSDQQLALFTDGQLSSKKHQQILSHLNECADCRTIWLETSQFLPAASVNQHNARAPRLINKLNDLLTPKPLIQFAMATSLCLLLVLSFPFSRSIDQQLNSEFEAIINQHTAETINIAKNLTMPWENSAFGFSKPIIAAEKKAFAAGLLQAKNNIVSPSYSLPEHLLPDHPSNWEESDQKHYFQLGRLTILLWIDSQLADNRDWKKHQQMLSNLSDQATKHPINETKSPLWLTSIVPIKEQINRIITSENSMVEKNKLKRLLAIFMQRMGSS